MEALKNYAVVISSERHANGCLLEGGGYNYMIYSGEKREPSLAIHHSRYFFLLNQGHELNYTTTQHISFASLGCITVFRVKWTKWNDKSTLLNWFLLNEM